MKCFIVHIGHLSFGLPTDTGICIQDLLLQAIPLTTSYKNEFTWKQDHHVTEAEVQVQSIEPEEIQVEAAETGSPPAPPTPLPKILRSNNPDYDDDIPF